MTNVNKSFFNINYNVNIKRNIHQLLVYMHTNIHVKHGKYKFRTCIKYISNIVEHLFKIYYMEVFYHKLLCTSLYDINGPKNL